MRSETQKSLLNACAKLFRPLVKICLRNGIDYAAVTETLRKVYVDVAGEHLVEQGSRPTISSIAAISGLTRKEAKRLKDLSDSVSDHPLQKYNRSSRVISGWLNDHRFTDDNGNPDVLTLETGEHSFAELVRLYSGDIPFISMLSVLESSSIVKRQDGKVELLQHAYIPESDPVDKINILGADVSELIGTIGHNLTAPTDQLFFQRKVWNSLLGDESLLAFKKLSAEKSQKLLEELNHWLGEHEIKDAPQTGAANYVAMGIYYTQELAP